MKRAIASAVVIPLTGSLAFGGDPLPGTMNFENITATNIVQVVAEQANNEKYVDVADFDNDGDPDVVVAAALSDFGQRRNKLYRNDAGVFNEVSGAPVIPGFSNTDTSRAAIFRDFDNDGFVDIWIVNDSNSGAGNPNAPGSDKFYRNVAGTSFVLEGGPRATGSSQTGTSADFDGNGLPDVYTGNSPNIAQDELRFNGINGDAAGVFTNVTNDQVPVESEYATDVAAADMNGDGKLDLLVSNWSGDPSFIYYNNNNDAGAGLGDFRYNDPGSETQLPQTGGARDRFVAPIDIDNDGALDFYWAGHETGGSDRVYLNIGNDGFNRATFSELDIVPSAVSDRTSRRVITADFNNDGRMDVFVAAEDGRPTVLRNATVEGDVLLIDWTPAPAFPTGAHNGWHAAALEINNDDRPDLFVGAMNDDFLFASTSSNEVAEGDLFAGGSLPALFNLDPVAVLGSAAAGETDAYQVSSPAGYLAVVLNGADDYLLEIYDGETLVATSSRGGLGVEEALVGQFPANPEIRVTVLSAATAGADFNDDGDVGPADLASLLENWGPCDSCPQDITGDGNVGPADLAQLLEAWGPVLPAEYILEVLGRTG